MPMSPVIADHLPLGPRNRRSLAIIAPTLTSLLRLVGNMTMKRSAALLVALGMLELLRRRKFNNLAHVIFTSFLHRMISNGDATPRHTNNMIASLKKDIAEYQLREEQKNSELVGLKESLREALSQQSSLLQGLAEGTALVMKLTVGMEEREKEIKAKTAEVESLVEVLKQEEARNGEREGRLLVSVAKEIKGELESQLDLMRETLASNNIFIIGLQSKIDSLEQNDVQEEHRITSFIQADDELESSVRSVHGKDSEISTLKQKIQEYESELVDKDVLIADLSSKVEEVRAGSLRAKGIDGPVSTAGMAVGENEELWHSTAKMDTTESEELDRSFDVMRNTLKEKDLAEKELERNVAQMDSGLTENEKRITSLLKVNRKQEDRLAEMEGRMLVLTSTYEHLADMRTREKQRFENEIYSLRQTLADTNDLITKVEEKVAELEAEAAVKDEKVKSLSQAERDLRARCAKKDKAIADLRGKSAAPTSPSRAQKPTRSKQDAMPDMQTVARYEQKIAELNDKLAECHGLLKGCLNSPSPGLTLSPLWPPPYETASKHADVRTVATASPARFDTPSFAAPERFSAPQ